eukprot:scaffold207368_cov21-Tisochrysis_lutea.AAC.3
MLGHVYVHDRLCALCAMCCACLSVDESRKRVKTGHSNGEYEADKPHGLTKFQAAWYQPPQLPPTVRALAQGLRD